MPTPGTLPLRFTQGDDFEVSLTFTDANDDPIDLSSHTGIAAQARKNHSSTEATDFAVDTTDAATGVIVLTLTETQTAELVPRGHVWDFEWTTPEGKTRTILKGSVTVDPEVTR